MKRKKQDPEELLEFHLRAAGIERVREYKFVRELVGNHAGVRKRIIQAGLKDWRLDFFLPSERIGVEMEGGGGMGRHTTAKGFRLDLRKYQAAQRQGITVYRCDADMVRSGEALKTIEILRRMTTRPI